MMPALAVLLAAALSAAVPVLMLGGVWAFVWFLQLTKA